jgi:hypothetical protein
MPSQVQHFSCVFRIVQPPACLGDPRIHYLLLLDLFAVVSASSTRSRSEVLPQFALTLGARLVVHICGDEKDVPPVPEHVGGFSTLLLKKNQAPVRIAVWTRSRL